MDEVFEVDGLENEPNYPSPSTFDKDPRLDPGPVREEDKNQPEDPTPVGDYPEN